MILPAHQRPPVLGRGKLFTMICGACEAEWDAEKYDRRGPCPNPACNFFDMCGEENVIRNEKEPCE